MSIKDLEEQVKRVNDLGRKELLNCGLHIPENPSTFDLMKAIRQIELKKVTRSLKEGLGKSFSVDENSTPYYFLNRIGGLSVNDVSDNLAIKFESKTEGGVEIKVDENGEITLNGTSTSFIRYTLPVHIIVGGSDPSLLDLTLRIHNPTVVGDDYGNSVSVMALDSAGSGVLIRATAITVNAEKTLKGSLDSHIGEIAQIQIYIPKGITLNDFKMFITLTRGNGYKGKEAYRFARALNPLKRIVAIGENNISPYAEKIVKSGITYTPTEDGKMIFNGTAEETVSVFREKTDIERGVYSISVNNAIAIGDSKENSPSLNIYGESGLLFEGVLDEVNKTFNAIEFIEKITSYEIVVPENAVLQDFTISLMMNRGENAIGFKKFKKNVYVLPTELSSFLQGFGGGLNENYNNYIDFSKKSYVQRTERLVLDGSENWLIDTERTTTKMIALKLSLPNIAAVPWSYASNFLNSGTQEQYLNEEVRMLGGTQNEIVIKLYKSDLGFKITSDYSTASEKFKNILAMHYGQNRPIVVEYALPEAIETDISRYLPFFNDIETMEGGSVKFETEYDAEIPYSLIYNFKEQE